MTARATARSTTRSSEGGRGPPTGVRKKIVVAAFHKIDEYSGGTAEGRKTACSRSTTSRACCTKEHPEVKGARRAFGVARVPAEVRGLDGNDGKVSLKEWLDYYNDLSKSYDSDDHFCTMVQRSWADLKLMYVEEKEVKALEKNLRDSIFAKSSAARRSGRSRRSSRTLTRTSARSSSRSSASRWRCTALHRQGGRQRHPRRARARLRPLRRGRDGLDHLLRVLARAPRRPDRPAVGSDRAAVDGEQRVDRPRDAVARRDAERTPRLGGPGRPRQGGTLPATPGGQSSRRGPAATGAAWTQSPGIFR